MGGGYLAKAGLTGAETILEETATKLRLVTLAQIYHEFCGLARDENPDVPPSSLAENLAIDPWRLEFSPPGQQNDDFEELTVKRRSRGDQQSEGEIFECFKSAHGDEVKLYTRIWYTRSYQADVDSEGADFVIRLPALQAM